jgi:hypothetical protein
MEDLRFIPLLMFFGGVLLIYSGFQNTTPLAMVRSFLSGSNADTGAIPSATVTNPYAATTDPFFAGTNTLGLRTYQPPVNTSDASLYPGG